MAFFAKSKKVGIKRSCALVYKEIASINASGKGQSLQSFPNIRGIFWIGRLISASFSTFGPALTKVSQSELHSLSIQAFIEEIPTETFWNWILYIEDFTKDSVDVVAKEVMVHYSKPRRIVRK